MFRQNPNIEFLTEKAGFSVKHYLPAAGSAAAAETAAAATAETAESAAAESAAAAPGFPAAADG